MIILFVDIFKELRRKSGLSQSQLAKNIGVSPGNISDWESGKTKPGYTALASIARFFEVDAGYLLELPRAESAVLCDGIPLSVLESDLVAMYRLLDEQGKETAFDLVEMLYEKKTGLKGSVYSTYTDEEKGLKKSGPAIGEDSTAELA